MSGRQSATSAPAPPDAPDAPDALDSLRHRRLRPGVTATVLRDGVHLRGWITSVSLEGSPALPALWEHLAEALATDGGRALAGAVPAGSPLRAALVSLIDRLSEHDLLVERGGHDGGGLAGGLAGQWLDTVADRPAQAAARLAGTRARVLGTRPDGAFARAAGRALDHGGTGAERAREELPDGRLLLVASLPDGELAVSAGVYAGFGFVTPVGSPRQARADAAALAERLGRVSRTGGLGEPGEHPALTALVAASAAQRLLCAAAGLPDPSAEAGGARLLPDRPAALVAGERPLRGEYRTWLGPDLVDADRALPGAVPRTLADALARIPVLGDGELGVLDAPSPGALPQLPVALVRCATPEGGLLSGAARADLARLDAVCRAAELRLGGAGLDLVVGAGPGHARGRALRRAAGHRDAAGRTPVEAPAGPPGRPVAWRPRGTVHPQARHWWSVLVRRLGVDAEAEVSRIAVDPGAFRAVVRGRTVAGGPPRVLGTAVEATADDAVAYAALSAAVRIQSEANAPDLRFLTLPSGASAMLGAASERAPWEDAGWTTAWLGETAGREGYLQDALAGATGRSPRPWEPAPGTPARPVWSALRQCGFSVLSLAPAPGRDRTGGTSRPMPNTPVEGPR
ncbi:hypothetical protein GCM10010387_51190 [Streptomyces inusitatus]|uniref:Uncharacterized protein n=1 Tax=Streptomyces inusitatus TaxID=68221 RepID=A0A918QIG0_9ACTN|nr:hypothetical protein [Streptomyces inusitatus]GGZ50674.1 hypothetical protein GCM10010387_51190 [Streptomyces inusitatus]